MRDELTRRLMLGSVLRRLREKTGLSLSGAAGTLMSRESVHGYERDRTVPPLDQASRLLARLRATPLDVIEAVRAAAPGAWPSDPVVGAAEIQRADEIRRRWSGVATRPIFAGRTRVQLTDAESELLAGAADDVEALLELVSRFTEPAAGELVPAPAIDGAAAGQEAA